MVLSMIKIIVTIYLFYSMMVFGGGAWNKREDRTLFSGNFTCALLSGCALLLIWR